MTTVSPLALVVEDDPVQAEIFTRAIADAGYQVQHLASGDAALNALQNETPLLVLLDLHLPKIAGMEILRFIRREPRLADTRVVLATADPRQAEIVRSETDLVLIKPISFGQLRALAQRLLPKPAH